MLGLRDVMDDPEILKQEWDRKNVFPALKDLYDEIWVYGPEGVCNPLEGMEVPQTVLDKVPLHRIFAPGSAGRRREPAAADPLRR